MSNRIPMYGTFNSVTPASPYLRAVSPLKESNKSIKSHKTNFTAAASQHLRPTPHQEFFHLILLTHKLNNQGIKVILDMDGKSLLQEATIFNIEFY